MKDKSIKDMNERQLQSYVDNMIRKWKSNNEPKIYIPKSIYSYW